MHLPVIARRTGSARPVKPALGRLPTGMLFLLPGLLGVAVFYILPFGISLRYSFLDRPVGGSFVGFANFLELLTNRAYLLGLRNTLRFIAISVPLNLGLSLGVAMLISKLPRHKQLVSLFFLIPLVIPSGSMVSFWRSLFALDGALNGILYGLGIERINWLGSDYAMLVMVLIFIWKNLGFNMVLYLAGLSSIPKDSYESAGIDGANPWQTFVHITLPGLASTSVLALIMSIVNSFKVFREIFLITGTHPHESIYTLQHFMNNMFASLNYPRLTSATTILVVMIAVFTGGLLRLERKISS